MNAKTKRPPVLDLEAMTIKAAAPEPAKPEPRPEPAPAAGTFRTSVLMSRAAHEILREIAHAERKPFAELFREGLDHVLTSRNFPTIAELDAKAK